MGIEGSAWLGRILRPLGPVIQNEVLKQAKDSGRGGKQSNGAGNSSISFKIPGIGGRSPLQPVLGELFDRPISEFATVSSKGEEISHEERGGEYFVDLVDVERSVQP